MKRITLILLSGFFTAIVFVQCKHDAGVTPTNNVAPITDAALFAETNTATGYTYYKDITTPIAKSGPSPHNPFFLVRFNSIAAAALTNDGKLPVGNSFPEGSIIVKELHNNAGGSNLAGIAIMKKASADPNAAENGWVWAEYFGSADNGVLVSTKGSSCNGCHSDGNNRDKVRLFDLFP